MSDTESRVSNIQNSSINEISTSFYNFIIGLTLLWGFIINAIIVKTISINSIQSIPSIIFVIGYFVSCIFGTYLFNAYNNPIVSFIGYNFVVIPFGLVLNTIVCRYDASLVVNAMSITGVVTFSMMFLGTMFPRLFQNSIGTITYALLLVVLYEWIAYRWLNIDRNAIDWIVVVIFCGYIGYDWGKANQIPRTVDNAIDSAAELYMDIINLFVRVLKILSRK